MAIPQITGAVLPLIFGTRPDMYNLPILNLPPGTLKVRRRFRSNSFAMATLRTAEGFRQFYLGDAKGGLILSVECAANIVN